MQSVQKGLLSSIFLVDCKPCFIKKAARLRLKIVLLLGFITLTNLVYASSTPTVWDVLRKQFAINHEINQPEVQNQLRWLMTHPNYVNHLAQAEPYIYHIVTEIRARKLPGEIALIPMIESSYNPFAYSGSGAAGLWQLMPETGNDFGLKQDWWIDGRRSIRPSTEAALKYLAYLHRFFNGDWLLAFAAYDSGEGTIKRMIKNNHGKLHFWSLPVSQETRVYIPRLLALAEIIQNPQRYHIRLPDIPHEPFFEEVNIGSQIDLNHAAKMAGISYHDLIKLNPGFNRFTTAPYRPYKLLIPADRVEHFSRNLAKLPDDERVSWTQHKVSAGDNLVIIAEKYHTTVNLIKELNRLKTTAVKKGQVVLIPSSKKTNALLPPTPAKPATRTYLVKKGDNLSRIALQHHTRLRTLKRLNPNAAPFKLKPGQRIRVG